MRKILGNKKAQEELVGFGLIVVIVVVAILFVLIFSLKNNSSQDNQSYQVGNFVQSVLQYTTNCTNYLGNYSVQDLIFQCANGNTCLNEENSCKVLNETVKGALDAGWNVQKGSSVKGYKMDILEGNSGLMQFKAGNQTNSYKGALENLAKGSYNIQISMQVYY